MKTFRLGRIQDSQNTEIKHLEILDEMELLMLSKLDPQIVLGQTPLTKEIFDQLATDRRGSNRSRAECCLAVINGLLLIGRYSLDCNYILLTIGHFDQEVVEEALQILRDEGGWPNTRIKSQSNEYGTTIEIY